MLRARGAWPRDRRARKCCDEIAPPHSITSSAVASSEGGSSKPSALAALRLITNSNATEFSLLVAGPFVVSGYKKHGVFH
jgi:hypothetical protein